VEDVHALHTGDAVRADLFLIGQDADGSEGRVLGGDLGHQSGICIDAVIVAVGSDHGAVEADVAGLISGDDLDFSAGKILLGDAVLLIKEDHSIQLDSFLHFLVVHSVGADEDVQFLGADAVAQLALALLSAQMGQQVGDAEDGIVLVLAHVHGDGGAVSAGEHAVDGQRHSTPLILADAAVVVGLEVAEVVGLVQRGRAQVQTGAVGVSDDQMEAVLEAAGADGGSHDGLAQLAEIDLVAGGVGLLRVELLVACVLEHLLALSGHLALGLARIEEFLVALSECVGLLLDGGGLVADVSGLKQQLFSQLLVRSFFCHRISPAFLFSYTCWKLFSRPLHTV
jgi:hypothetical protein